MTYCGSKRRIAKYIIPILEEEWNKGEYKAFVDLCCGGCNLIDKVKFADIKIATDKNPYLIALFKYLQDGGKLPSDLCREEFINCRAHPEQYQPWQVGAISILGSFAGRGFAGGFAPPKDGRNAFQERSRSAIKQMENLKDVIFIVRDLFEINPKGCLIYCDPPYKSNQAYGKEYRIDHEKFWQKMRELSVDNAVFISELEAPEDFEIVWSQDLLYNIATAHKTVNERLFKWKGN